MAELVSVSSADLANASDPESTVMALCDAGRGALAEAQSVAAANAVLGKVKLLEHATRLVRVAGEAAIAASSLRVDAERRVGQLIAAERDAGRMATQSTGRPRLRSIPKSLDNDEAFVAPVETAPTKLADLGISYDEASRYNRLAEADDETFEAAKQEVVERAQEQGGTNVTATRVLETINPERERSDDKWWLLAGRFAGRAGRLAHDSDDVIKAIRFNKFPGDWPEIVRNGALRELEAGRDAINAVLKEMHRE